MIKYQPLFCSPEESDHIHFSSPAWYFPSAYSQHTHAQLHSITCTPWSQCQRGLSLMGEWEFWRQMSVCQAPPSAASRRTAGSRWRGIKNKNKNNQEEDEEKETGGGGGGKTTNNDGSLTDSSMHQTGRERSRSWVLCFFLRNFFPPQMISLGLHHVTRDGI